MASNHYQVSFLGQCGIPYNLSNRSRFEDYFRSRPGKLLDLIRFLLRYLAEHHG